MTGVFAFPSPFDELGNPAPDVLLSRMDPTSPPSKLRSPTVTKMRERTSSIPPRPTNPAAASSCGITHPTVFPPNTAGMQYVKRNAVSRREAAEKTATTIPIDA